MSNLILTSFTFLIPATCLCLTLSAANDLPVQTMERKDGGVEVTSKKPGDSANEPIIKAQYYGADTIQALPRLKPLAGQEPEYNKILFKLDGYPKHKEIILEIKRLASLDPKAYEPKVSFTIQDDGSMLISNSNQQLKTIISSSRGFLPGERVFYRFRTADGSADKEISGTPTPAIVKTKDDKVAIKAELVSVNPTVYKIDIPILNDDEEYELKSTSLGEITRAKPKYSKNQPIHFAPAGKNTGKGGEATFEISRKSGDVYTIILPWGSALEAYLQGLKAYSPK